MSLLRRAASVPVGPFRPLLRPKPEVEIPVPEYALTAGYDVRIDDSRPQRYRTYDRGVDPRFKAPPPEA